MPRLFRSRLRLIASLAVLSYLGAVGYVKLSEKTLIFRPGERRVGPSPSQFDLREKRLTYPSTDGVTLSAWIVPSAAPLPSDPWLLISHGNFGSVGYGGRPEFYASMRDLGVKRFVEVRGGHDNSFRIDKSVYYGAIAEFLRDTGPRR